MDKNRSKPGLCSVLTFDTYCLPSGLVGDKDGAAGRIVSTNMKEAIERQRALLYADKTNEQLIMIALHYILVSTSHGHNALLRELYDRYNPTEEEAESLRENLELKTRLMSVSQDISERLKALEPQFQKRRELKAALPFEIVTGEGELGEYGFTADESEQRVDYPFHNNVPTRIYFDLTTHDVLLQRDAEGRASLLLAPKEGITTSRID